MTLIAMTRSVSRSLGQCELTHQVRAPIDIGRARAQHATYEACLQDLGCHLVQLPEMPEHPDAVFVEDTVVVLEELAIITRPGATSRRGETESIAQAMAPFRERVNIISPGTLDGGDVLVVGRDIFVGLSSRTNPHAVEQLRNTTQPYGYCVKEVDVRGCLHLKSAVTAIGPSLLLVNAEWIDVDVLSSYEVVDTHPRETHAANGLRINDVLVYPAAFPETAKRITERGIELVTVDLSELAKAEGAVTCCSVIVSTD